MPSPGNPPARGWRGGAAWQEGGGIQASLLIAGLWALVSAALSRRAMATMTPRTSVDSQRSVASRASAEATVAGIANLAAIREVLSRPRVSEADDAKVRRAGEGFAPPQGSPRVAYVPLRGRVMLCSRPERRYGRPAAPISAQLDAARAQHAFQAWHTFQGLCLGAMAMTIGLEIELPARRLDTALK